MELSGIRVEWIWIALGERGAEEIRRTVRLKIFRGQGAEKIRGQ